MEKILAETAAILAKYAHTDLFESRRGIRHIGDDLILVYNNNPYAADPGRRDEEMALLEVWLGQVGLPALATASYPTEGDSAGYTAVILTSGTEEDVTRISAKYEELTTRGHRLVCDGGTDAAQ